MRLLVPKIEMKIDPYYQQQKYKPMTLVSGNTGFMRIFAVRNGLAARHRATSENNCLKTNEDRHILSAVQIFITGCSFWQYKACADIRSGSLEKRR